MLIKSKVDLDCACYFVFAFQPKMLIKSLLKRSVKNMSRELIKVKLATSWLPPFNDDALKQT